MTEHTPLPKTKQPWKIGTATLEDTLVVGADGSLIAAFPHEWNGKANAAYIVKAANLAPQLASALEAVEWSYSNQIPGSTELAAACPTCYEQKPTHDSDCKLDAALSAWRNVEPASEAVLKCSMWQPDFGTCKRWSDEDIKRTPVYKDTCMSHRDDFWYGVFEPADTEAKR